MNRLALLAATLATAVAIVPFAIAGCMETGPDAPPRKNGCIYLECEDAAPLPSDGGGSDAPVGARDPLEGTNKIATLLKGGFQFTEGPLWIGDKLLFSDTAANTIFALTGTTSTTFRANSNAANGNALTADNKLVTCEGSAHRVVRGDITTPATVASVADTFAGKKLNSPNDVIVKGDGTIYFTDPSYGGVDGTSNQLPFEGAYRIPAGGGAPARLDKTFVRANGIGLSVAQSKLYVVDNGEGSVYAASVNGDGTVGAFDKLADTPGGDGMAVDDDDNLYVASTDGVRVLGANGSPRGTIAVAEQPSNCSFGGSDRRTLFITARTGVYSVAMGVPGLP